MELSPQEIKHLKIDSITKGIDSLKRASRTTNSPIIKEVYDTQAAELEKWKSQIIAGK